MKIFIVCLFYSFLIVAKVHSTVKVGVIGDSISVPKDSYIYLVQEDLKREGFPIQLINYSISGSKTTTVLERLKKMLVSEKPDILILAIGVNDFNSFPLNKTQRNIEEAIKLAVDQNIYVILGTIDLKDVPWGKILPTKARSFNLIYEELSEDYPSILTFDFLNQQILVNPKNHIGDYLHPNAAGYRLIANSLQPVLQNLLIRKFGFELKPAQ